ncbi:MAG: cysteine peptidase family C39 domain-containing protein, partial [Candidatus Omnitrophota bacterium]
MLKPKAHTDDRVVSKEEAKPVFKSSFKAWIRVVAFVVAAVFLPEQVAQAVEYDWRVLWNKPAIGLPSQNTFAPSYLKNVQTINIPQAVKSILKDIANKPVTSIKISDNLTIDLDKPLKMSNQRIDELYNWLIGKPCGSKALYDLLSYKGVKVEEQDIAVFALTIDILNDVVKPEGNPKVIKNSLYALSKASEFFGLKLSPAKIDSLQDNLPTPFIAHLNGGHYVLITKVSNEKIYFLDEHQEEFLPLEKFLQDFSGYALIPGLSPQGTVALTDSEAKKVLGARSNKNGYADITSLFEEPSNSDLMLGLGITVAACAVSSYFGNSSFISAFGQGAFYSQVGQAAINVGVRNLGMSPTTAQIFGTATIGALSGGTSAYAQGATTFSEVGKGALNGALLGATKASASVFAYDALKDTSFFKNNPYIGRQFANLAGSTIGYAAFMGTMGALAGTPLDTEYKFKTEVTPKQVAVLINENSSDDLSNIRMETRYFAFGDKGIAAADVVQENGGFYGWVSPKTFTEGLKYAWDDMKGSLVQQGVGLAVEYAASEGWLGSALQKHPGYSRLLGEPLGGIAGAKVTGGDLKKSIFAGISSGLVSTGLSALGGDYNSVTGKNNWGLTKLQMSTLNFLGTGALYAGLTRDGQGTGGLLANWATNYTTFGGTSPLYTKGARGWSEVQYIEKLSQLAGVSDFKANVDYAMKQKGYSDWNKFIDDGNLSSLMPSISYSLVNYAQSSLHYAAVNNISATMEWLPSPATYYLGIGWRDRDEDGDVVIGKWNKYLKDWVKDESFKSMAGAFGNEYKGIFKTTDATGKWVGLARSPKEIGTRQYFSIDGLVWSDSNKQYKDEYNFYAMDSGYQGKKELGGWTAKYYSAYYGASAPNIKNATSPAQAYFNYQPKNFEIFTITSRPAEKTGEREKSYIGIIKDKTGTLTKSFITASPKNLYEVISRADNNFFQKSEAEVLSIKVLDKGLPIDAAKTTDWTVLGDSSGNLRTVKPAMDTQDFTKNYDVEVTVRKSDGSLESIRGRQDGLVYGHKIAELEKGDILALDETIKPSHDFSRQGTIEIMGLNKGIFFDTYKSVARFGEGQGVNGVTRMENGRLNENSWFLTSNNKGDMRLVYKTVGDKQLLSGVYGNLYKRNSNVVIGDEKSFVAQEYTLKDLAGSKYESAATDILSQSYNDSGELQESKVSGELVSVIDAKGQMVDAFRVKDGGELYYAITKKGNDPADNAELERLRLTFKGAGIANEKIDTFKALGQASIPTLYVNPSNNYSVNSISGQFTTINWGEGLSPNLENIKAKLVQDTHLTSTKESYTNLIYHSRINTAEDGVIAVDDKRAFSVNDKGKAAYMRTYEGKVLYADKADVSTNISQISDVLRWDTDKIEGMTLADGENINAVKSFIPADLKKIEGGDATRALGAFAEKNFKASGDFKHLGAKITEDKNNYRDFNFYTIGEKIRSGDVAISAGEVYLDGQPKDRAEAKTFYSNLPESLKNETYTATNEINKILGGDRDNDTFTLALLGKGESNVAFYTMGGFGAEPRVPTANEALPSWLKVDVSPAEEVDFNINTSNQAIKTVIQEMVTSKTIDTDKPVTVERKDITKLILNIGNDNSGAVYALYAHKADAAQSWAQYGNTGWLGEGKYYNYQLRGLNTPYFGDVKFGSLQDTKGQDVK